MIIGICDDRELEHSSLMELCKLYGEHDFLHYYSGEELLDADRLPELLFLDIEMPGTDGLSIMRKLECTSGSPYIIFYTSHIELGMRAYGTKVIGFLQKPVSGSDVEKCLARTQNLLSMNDYITFENNQKVRSRDIVYIESSKNYAIFHPVKGTPIFSRISMAEWADSLPSCFVSIHKSYIVNFYHVDRLDKNHIVLDDNDNKTLPISRRRQKEVVAKYENFLFHTETT